MKSAITFDYFIKEYQFEKKMLIVPSYTVGEQYVRQAIKKGLRCINLELKTIDDLAFDLCQIDACLNGEELKLINQNHAINLMMDIMQEEINILNYFNDQNWIDSQTAGEIIHQINDVRMMGRQDCFYQIPDSQKLKDLSILIKAYESRLESEELTDRVKLFKRAIELTENENYPQIRLGVLANTRAVGMEKHLLNAIAGESFEIIKAPSIAGIDVPADFYENESEYFERGNELSGIYDDEKKKIENPAVDFFKSYGQVNEFKFVVQDILEKDYTFGDVQVLFSDVSYSLLLYNYAHSINFKLSLPGGIPGYHSEIYALLRDIFAFARNGYFEEDLRLILHNRSLLNFSDKISNRRLFENLRKTNIGFGRERFIKTIEEFNQFENDENENENHNLYLLGNFLKSILELFPEDLRQKVNYRNFILKIIDFLSACCKKKSTNGDFMRERQQFINELTEFGKYATTEMSANLCMDQILMLLEGLSVQASPETADAVLCTSFGSAGIITRPYVYVIGLDADRFPFKSNESPVLLDDERTRLGLVFGLSGSLEKESIYGLIQSLSGNIRRVVFGYNYFDTVGIKEKNASSFYNRLLEIQSLDKKEVKMSGFVNENRQVLEQKEYYLRATKKQEASKRIRRKAIEMESVVKPSDEISPLSATKIMDFLECPRKFFYKYRAVLKIPEKTEFDRTVWLDPRNKGNHIHKVLENYVKKIIITDKKKDFDKTAFIELYEQNCKEMLELVPPLSSNAYELSKKQCQSEAENYLIRLCNEMKTENFIPYETELTFGKEQKDPVEIPLLNGNTMRLSGAIDRVDLLENGTYRIVDYKTGKYAKLIEKRKNGLSGYIQDFVYAIVLETMKSDQKALVSESRYDYLSDMNRQLKTEITEEKRNEAVETLNRIVDDIKQGKYERCQENEAYKSWDNTCKYCDYTDLCKSERWTWEEA